MNRTCQVASSVEGLTFIEWLGEESDEEEENEEGEEEGEEGSEEEEEEQDNKNLEGKEEPEIAKHTNQTTEEDIEEETVPDSAVQDKERQLSNGTECQCVGHPSERCSK